MKTWGRLTMWQTWCLSPFPFSISQVPCQLHTCFRKYSNPSFQWLAAARNENFLWSLVALSLSRPLPVCYIFSGARRSKLTCTVLQWSTCDCNCFILNLNNSKYSVYKIYILIHFVFTSHCMFVLSPFPVEWLIAEQAINVATSTHQKPVLH